MYHVGSVYMLKFGEFYRAGHLCRVHCCVVWFPVDRTRVVIGFLGDAGLKARKDKVSVLSEVLED